MLHYGGSRSVELRMNIGFWILSTDFDLLDAGASTSSNQDHFSFHCFKSQAELPACARHGATMIK